jgi:ABC-2 type transport system ATP-binding protein
VHHLMRLVGVTHRHIVPDPVRRLRRRAGPGIHDVNLELTRGAIVGLVGRNGSGKTTLLRTLAGVLEVQQGSVVDAEGAVLDAAQRRRRVGHMPEQVRWQGRATPRTTLMELAVMDGGRLDLIDGVMRLVGIHERADDMLDSLSQGMRQRLTLATAMLGSPDLLLLDEPYNGLDPSAARSLTRVLQRLAQRGVTVVVSSHHLGHLAGLVDRLVLVERGRILAEGSAESLADDLGIERPWETVVEGERPSGDAVDLGGGAWRVVGPRMNADLLASLGKVQVLRHGRRELDLADLLEAAVAGGEEE